MKKLYGIIMCIVVVLCAVGVLVYAADINNKIKTDYDEYSKEIAAMQSTISSQQSVIDTQAEEIAENEKELAQYTTQISSLSSAVKALQTKVNELNK